MVRVGEESDLYKSQLVAEICSISSNAHHCRVHSTIKTPFMDWYLLLRVDDNARSDVIRKQYRKLALQLHPDKNRHPKAEIAFKLVSEAYACLSDKAKRKAFDSVRCNRLCQECNRISYKTCSSPAAKRVTSNKIFQQLKEVREKFREEVRIIEKCLKVNKASNTEYPVFDPSDHVFQDHYSHKRPEVCRKPGGLQYLRARNFESFDHRRGKCESPIFEVGSGRTLGQRKFVSLSA